MRARSDAAAADELRSLDAELVTARRARLKQFYAEQNALYQEELSEMGLSLNFD